MIKSSQFFGIESFFFEILLSFLLICYIMEKN